MSRLLLPTLLAFGLLLSACGDDEPSTLIGANPDAGAPAGDPCGAVTSQPCSCSASQSGTQTCSGGVWSQCMCTGGGNTTGGTTAGFTGGSISGQLCKAGYYTGKFTGEYFSGVFDPSFIFGGQIGSLFGVPVTALPRDGKPGLALTLEEATMSAGQEFSTSTVEDGCVVGVADAFGFANPFVGVLRGELNCSTGEFDGTMEGYYTLLEIPGANFGFEGPVSAQFYADSQKLDDGVWDVDEESMAANPPGGEGDWEVEWTGEIEDAPPLPQECIDFLEGRVDAGSSAQPDAGTTVDAGGTSDAGTSDAGTLDGGV